MLDNYPLHEKVVELEDKVATLTEALRYLSDAGWFDEESTTWEEERDSRINFAASFLPTKENKSEAIAKIDELQSRVEELEKSQQTVFNAAIGDPSDEHPVDGEWLAQVVVDNFNPTKVSDA
jgi:uncharacterized protein YydD (DUF2326 family)